jgi:hypothetical protein
MNDSDCERLLVGLGKRWKRHKLCSEVGHRLVVAFMKQYKAIEIVEKELQNELRKRHDSEFLPVKFFVEVCLAVTVPAVMKTLKFAIQSHFGIEDSDTLDSLQKYFSGKIQSFIKGHVDKVLLKYSSQSQSMITDYMKETAQSLSEQCQAMRQDIQDEQKVSMAELVALHESFDAKYTTVDFFVMQIRESFHSQRSDAFDAIGCPNHHKCSVSPTSSMCNKCWGFDGLILGCRWCNWDICSVCAIASASDILSPATKQQTKARSILARVPRIDTIKCPNHHKCSRPFPLNRYYRCNVCLGAKGARLPKVGCRLCKWDICSACASIRF